MPNPCELPRHMYYLSYSADGEQAHPPAGTYPSAPCTPEPDGPRAAVLPERDPLANSSQLGAGKVNLQFSEDTRWAFRRTPEQAARCKIVILSRFAVLSVSLTLTASLIAVSTSRASRAMSRWRDSLLNRALM